MRWFGTRTAGAALALVISWGCSEDSGVAKTPAEAGANAGQAQSEATAQAPKAENADSDDLAKRGERLYIVNCIACHHRDPAQDGGLGPPVAGASLELIEARVMRSEYPPGYTPKQDTRLMVPLRHLEPDLEALAAYLGAQ